MSKEAGLSFEIIYQRHEAVTKDLSQFRKPLANDTRETDGKEYFQNAPVFEVDRQINQLLGQADIKDCDDESPSDKDWELLVLEYVFPERARLVGGFFRLEVERCSFHENRTAVVYREDSSLAES